MNSYIDNYGHYDTESPIVYLHHEETKPAANRKAHFNVCKELLKGFYFYIKLYAESLPINFNTITISIHHGARLNSHSHTKVYTVDESNIEGDKHVFEIYIDIRKFTRVPCYINNIIHEFAHVLHYMETGALDNLHNENFNTHCRMLCNVGRKIKFGACWLRY